MNCRNDVWLRQIQNIIVALQEFWMIFKLQSCMTTMCKELGSNSHTDIMKSTKVQTLGAVT